MRVLTWNLYHGRAVPPAGRDLLAEFAAALAGWDWDVALLQEVPPWWPPRARRGRGRERAHGADLAQRGAAAAPARSPSGWPDLIKSNGGGRQRDPRARRAIAAEHRRGALRRRPERRVVPRRAAGRRDVGAPTCTRRCHSERARAGRHGRAARGDARRWAGGAPASCSAATPTCATRSRPGFDRAGGHGVDYVLGPRPRRPRGAASVLDRGALSRPRAGRSSRSTDPRRRAEA